MTAIRKAGRELGLTQFGSRKGDRRASTTSTGPGRQASFGIKLRSRLQVKRTARAQPWQLRKQRRYNAETRRRPVRRARARIFVQLAEALAKSVRSLARTAAAPARSSKGSAAPKYKWRNVMRWSPITRRLGGAFRSRSGYLAGAELSPRARVEGGSVQRACAGGPPRGPTRVAVRVSGWLRRTTLPSSQGRKWTFSKPSTVCPFGRPFSWPSRPHWFCWPW